MEGNLGLTEYNRLRLLDRLAKSSHGIMNQPAIKLLRGVEEVHK